MYVARLEVWISLILHSSRTQHICPTLLQHWTFILGSPSVGEQLRCCSLAAIRPGCHAAFQLQLISMRLSGTDAVDTLQIWSTTSTEQNNKCDHESMMLWLRSLWNLYIEILVVVSGRYCNRDVFSNGPRHVRTHTHTRPHKQHLDPQAQQFRECAPIFNTMNYSSYVDRTCYTQCIICNWQMQI